jgi:hypothetical protein
MTAYGKLSGLCLATSLAVFSPGLLTDNALAQSLAKEIPGIVKGETKAGIAYMIGGVGIGEREKMTSLAADYNLKLAFAEKSGVYLAGVNVSVEDQRGQQLIDVTTNGPWVYLQLPPGSYTVTATFDGETRKIDDLRIAGQGLAQRVLHWDLPGEFPIYAQMRNEVQKQQVSNK